MADVLVTLRSACLELGRWLLTGYGGVSLGFGSPREALADAGAAAYTAIGGNVGADVVVEVNLALCEAPVHGGLSLPLRDHRQLVEWLAGLARVKRSDPRR